MPNIKLRVIPKPAEGTRSVINLTGPGTVAFSGHGDVVLECGNCGEPLAENVQEGQLSNLVIRCNNCAEYNETLD